VVPGNCPAVADLIDFALGRAGADGRQRVQAHLQGTGCNHCRSWIDKATACLHAQDEAGKPSTGGKEPARQPPTKTSRASISDWQCAAFRDLEQRLQRLDELESN
jgi:hypothetical protein